MTRASTTERTALRVLEQGAGEVVRYRLLRDVLRRPDDDPELKRARGRLDLSRCVQELEGEQREDGGWGPFHSRSTRLKQRIPSTEVGVERALALGLDRSHPVLQKAVAYIIDIMESRREFPDRHERNDRWEIGMRLFLASTLSLIEPEHEILNEDRELWVEITRRTFRSGEYSEEDEVAAHAELTGATVKDSYLVLNNRYSLSVLGSARGLLSPELEGALLDWLWNREDGIGYLCIPLSGEPPCEKAGHFDRWLTSLEMLGRLFPGWVDCAWEAVEWIWEQRDAEGTWDFGPRPSSGSYLPLSDSWRRRQDRRFDWTARVLVLLRRFCDGLDDAS
ncbi:MAG: hypothetical protein GWN58_07305 [Anaerolineae bacterium]|nr:hypothetical protein [Anaerolineae bacterium]